MTCFICKEIILTDPFPVKTKDGEKDAHELCYRRAQLGLTQARVQALEAMNEQGNVIVERLVLLIEGLLPHAQEIAMQRLAAKNDAGLFELNDVIQRATEVLEQFRKEDEGARTVHVCVPGCRH